MANKMKKIGSIIKYLENLSNNIKNPSNIRKLTQGDESQIFEIEYGQNNY
jgi:hypothetical protein